MATTVKLNITADLDGYETLSASESPAADDGGVNRIGFGDYKKRVQLTGSTTPDVSAVVDLSHALSGGTTKDFDLTAAPLAREIGKTIDLTGLKLVAIQFNADDGNNASGMTLAPQGASGYNLFGSSGLVVLLPGMSLLLAMTATLAANTPAVAAGAKDLRWTGTDGDAIECIAYFG